MFLAVIDIFIIDNNIKLNSNIDIKKVCIKSLVVVYHNITESLLHSFSASLSICLSMSGLKTADIFDILAYLFGNMRVVS